MLPRQDKRGLIYGPKRSLPAVRAGDGRLLWRVFKRTAGSLRDSKAAPNCFVSVDSIVAAHNLCMRDRPIESRRSGIGISQFGSSKHLRIAVYILDPKIPHDPLHILRTEAIPIRMFAAELAQARDPRIQIVRVWRKPASVGL